MEIQREEIKWVYAGDRERERTERSGVSMHIHQNPVISIYN